MKKYKKIDFWISCLLIMVFTVISLAKKDETVFVGYFTVGAWQLMSMIIHAINKWFTESNGVRYYYHWTVLWIMALAAAGAILTPILIILLYVMLFAAPIMAIYYTVLCYDEVFVKMQRPIALLK